MEGTAIRIDQQVKNGNRVGRLFVDGRLMFYWTGSSETGYRAFEKQPEGWFQEVAVYGTRELAEWALNTAVLKFVRVTFYDLQMYRVN
jgi:hypothetical protein